MIGGALSSAVCGGGTACWQRAGRDFGYALVE